MVSIAILFTEILTFLLYSSPFIILILLFGARIIWRKHPLEAVILEKRGENLIKTNDRVGRFFDKYADMHYYKFKKTKDTIPIYNYDWVLHNVSVPANILEKLINMLQGNVGTLFLFKYGSKQYKPINVKEQGKTKKKFVLITDDKDNPVYAYQYVQFDPRKQVGVLDFEIIDWDNMNFTMQEIRASMVRRAKKGEFMKQIMIPLAIIGAAVLVSIIILKFSFDAGKQVRGGITSSSPPEDGGSKIGSAIGNVVNPAQ